jgi:hypothetical protein
VRGVRFWVVCVCSAGGRCDYALSLLFGVFYVVVVMFFGLREVRSCLTEGMSEGGTNLT